ncbi:MAG: ABC transporter permease subunit [Planctomycetes bacterium]|nr:ABC transporter permease subunit [Planctomycetota bacterium]
MGRVLIIAGTTYREAGRQPILYILAGFFAVLIYLARWFTLFAFHVREEQNMIREMGVASLTVCGLFAAIMLAALAVTSEVEKLTTLTILSKPVRRSEFLLGKYLGILWVVFLCIVFLSLILVWTLWEKEGERKFERALDLDQQYSWHKEDHPDDPYAVPANLQAEEFPRLGEWLPFLFAARAPDEPAYRFRVPFTAPCAIPHGAWHELEEFFGVRMVDLASAVLLAFIQIAILGAFAVGVSPHVPLVVNGSICLCVFVIGHLSTYAHDVARTGGAFARILGETLYAVVPNLSLFNASSLLAVGSAIPGRYVACAGLYGLLYLSAVLTVAMAIFSRKEVR